MATARYYDESKDVGGVIAGVPKADIPEEEWDTYPDHLQASVDADPMYRKTPVPKPKAKDGD
jgi:hypothetical protein